MKFTNFIKRIQRKIVEQGSSEQKANYWRKQGMIIGKNCVIDTMSFSTEPYLIEIGDDVAITSGAKFVTHDGSVRCFRGEVNGGIFGKIKIGNNVFIGTGCIILYNTTIGDNCIIGVGSVVRGKFPDNSVIMGNPAKVVLSTNIQKILFKHHSGFILTNNRTRSEVRDLVEKHFNIK